MTAATTGGWVGRAMPRVEDPRFLAGRATYVDDVVMPGMLHVAMVRSPHAHARIARIDVAAAARHPGVAAVMVGDEIARLMPPLRPLIPIPGPPATYPLAVGKVRYVGEPVVALAACDRATAEDAADLVRIDYEPLPAVVDPERALEPAAPVLFDELGGNVLWHDTLDYGDVDGAFAGAAHVIRERFTIHRYASTPLETFGVIAAVEPGTGQVTIWSNDGRPGLTSGVVAAALGIPVSRLRLLALDVGGGFGNKRKAPLLILAALLARRTGRAVKYVEDRRESLTALAHAANGVMDVALAVGADGRFLALTLRDVVDEGANLQNPTLHNLLKLGNVVNCYRIAAVRIEAYSVLTNKCPSGANRGIGKPAMCFAIERIVDIAARRLGRDAIELRFANFIPPEAFPYETPVGARYDSGDYPETLRRALALAGWDELRALRDDARRAGRLVGLGLATAVEPSTSNLSSYMLATGKPGTSGVGEAALVRVELDGSVRVATGNVGSGQGYPTVIAQIVADELGVAPAAVSVSPWFDSHENPWMFSSGNFSNKFSGTDTGAIVGAARAVRTKLFAIAGHLLEASSADLEARDGVIGVRGAPGREVTVAQVAGVAYRDLLALPPGAEGGLEARYYYVNPNANLPDAGRRVAVQLTFSNSAHVVAVEIDPGTGGVKFLRYAIAHDCGREINPMIVEGMVHGSTAHGIGGALHEEFVYDDEGQLLTTTFLDYTKPTAMDVPSFRVEALETPSPVTPLGSKGVGEGGAIPSLAAIASAVEDALAPLGVTITALPLTPARLWQAMQAAGRPSRG
ncbi:MAG: xanthine dehydrogenase family protein molybdopterin-binding subunit [Candidatus Rokubacteria bacterium]|nr:xanthine dehydrogenase family protein molybdopterin-binding subunit [Candidatus Rokubacteria bacterium]